MFKLLLDGISGLVYPPICPACKGSINARFPEGKLCPQCSDNIEFNQPPFCMKCSRSLRSPDAFSYCHDCRGLKPEFDFAWCALQYGPVVQKLVLEFKYHQKTYLRHAFLNLITRFIATHGLDMTQFDMVMPVPLFPTRLRERGYNQAEILARDISRHYGLRLCTGYLTRARYARPQTLLKKEARIENIRDAFEVRHPLEIRGRSVLIIDDLLTTGATASEAAKTLKTAGAGTVGVLALAGVL